MTSSLPSPIAPNSAYASPSCVRLIQVASFADKLHADGQHLVVIVDPGIANVQGYPAYDLGQKAKAFITNPDGSEFVGKVSCTPHSIYHLPTL